MARVFKWIAIVIVAMILLLVIAVGAILWLVDPNDYRGEIERAVAEQTGRELTIEGDLGLTFFPQLGLSLGQTRLADAPGFGDEPFVQIDNAALAVEVMPLLSGDLELDTIVLRRPEIRLIRNAEGKANWQTLSQGESGGDTGSPGAGAVAVPAMLREARLAGLRIEEATVHYIDRQAGTELTLDPFNLSLEDVALDEPITIESDWRVAVSDGPTLQGSLTSEATVARDLSAAGLQDLVIEMTASGLGTPPGKQNMTLKANVDADLDADTIELSDLVLTAAEARLEGSAEVQLGEVAPVATGKLTIPELNPRAVMQALSLKPPKTRDEQALTRFSGDLGFRFDGNRMKVQPIDARLDDSKLTGDALVRDFAGPGIDFQLKLDHIDVDRYLPPPVEGEELPTGELPEGEAPPVGELPLETLRGLDLNGQIQVGTLTVAGAKTEDIDIKITAKDGDIRVDPMTAQLYGGNLSGDVHLDATGKALVASVNQRLEGIQAQPLLSDVAGFSKLLGSGGIDIQGSAKGADALSLLQALKGEAVFEFVDGAIDGINIAAMLRRGMATLQGQAADAGGGTRRTDFSSLTGRVSINGTKLNNESLSMKTPLLRLEGSGTADILSQALDYKLNINVVGTLAGQGGQDLEKLQGVTVPLRIQGSFSDPSFKLAIADALQGQAQEALQQQADQAKERLEEEKRKLQEQVKEKQGETREKLEKKLQEKAGEKLKGLFD